MKTFSLPTLLVLPVIVLLTSCQPSVQFNDAMPPGRFDLPNIPARFAVKSLMMTRSGALERTPST